MFKKRKKINEPVAPVEQVVAEIPESEEVVQETKCKKKSCGVTKALAITFVASLIVVVATKKLFDEIFVEDDWSDVDWGDDDEDFGVDID